jgi:FkbM family methyltransferase
MKIIEYIKLVLRANRYKRKNDRGGIKYVLSSVEQGQTVLDIGAHKAGYLYFFIKQVGKKGKIYAFEPQRKLYQYLLELKNIMGWQNVTIEHLALSDATGKATLYIPNIHVKKGSSPGASIRQSQNMDEVAIMDEVNTESLDTYCKQGQIRPNFIKIDVEGNELSIFKGALETLQICKPKIIVEIEARHVGRPQAQETITFLENLGYHGYFLEGINKIPVAQFDFDIHQNPKDKKKYCNNFVFEPK